MKHRRKSIQEDLKRFERKKEYEPEEPTLRTMLDNWFTTVPVKNMACKPQSNIDRLELCFRIEDADGNGIYQSYDVDTHPCRVAGEHPVPYGDSKLKDPWDHLINSGQARQYYFGFSSMEQLRRWFYSEEWCRSAKDYGFTIVIYQTNDYHIGDTQMVFRKETAKLIGKADLI